MDDLADLELTAEELAEAGMTMDDLKEDLEEAKRRKPNGNRRSGEMSEEVPSHIDVNSEDLKDPEMMAELKELGFSSDDDEEVDCHMSQSSNEVERCDAAAAAAGVVSEGDAVAKEERAAAPAWSPAKREKEIADLQAKALALYRGGRKEEAMVAMKRMKRLQALQGHGSTEALLEQGSEIGQRASEAQELSRLNTDEVQARIKCRLKEYTNAALKHKQNGRLNEAKAMMPDIRLLKSLSEKAEKGLISSSALADLPPALDKEQENERDDSKNDSLSAQDEISGNKMTKQSPEVSRRELEYDTIEDRMRKQLDRMLVEAKEALRIGKKDLAREIMQMKSRTQHELEILQTARKKGYPTPPVKVQRRKILKNHTHEHVNMNELELEIARAEGLSPPSGWKVCSSYVHYELTYPKDKLQKGNSEVVKSDDPEYGFKAMLKFPRPQRGAGRMFKFIKVYIQVLAPRLLFKDIVLGTLDVKLGDLLGKSDIVGKFPLRGGRGFLHVCLRLRTPLAGTDVRPVIVEDIILAHCDTLSLSMATSSHQARPASCTPSRGHSRSSSRPDIRTEPSEASMSMPTTPTASSATYLQNSSSDELPSGIDAKDWKNPLRVEAMCSNDVLTAEIAEAQQKIALRVAKKEPIPPEVQTHYKAMNAAQSALVAKVTEGALTLPDYLSIIRKDITRLSNLAAGLQSGGRAQEAEKIKSWIKIEMAEVKTAEENIEE